MGSEGGVRCSHCTQLNSICLLLLQGVGNDVLTGTGGPLADVELSQRVAALNNLLRTGKVALFKQGAHLLYKSAQSHDSR